MTNQINYPARLEIDYPEGRQDTLSTLFRFLWIIPIAIILGLITDAGQTVTYRVFLNESGEVIRRTRRHRRWFGKQPGDSNRADDYLQADVPALVVRLCTRTYVL